jgi:hypothetical protein
MIVLSNLNFYARYGRAGPSKELQSKEQTTLYPGHWISAIEVMLYHLLKTSVG